MKPKRLEVRRSLPAQPPPTIMRLTVASRGAARWDTDKKCWYVPVGTDTVAFGRWMPTNRVYLRCPYAEKDEAKQLGARWDNEQRAWYVPKGVDPAPFAKWRVATA